MEGGSGCSHLCMIAKSCRRPMIELTLYRQGRRRVGEKKTQCACHQLEVRADAVFSSALSCSAFSVTNLKRLLPPSLTDIQSNMSNWREVLSDIQVHHGITMNSSHCQLKNMRGSRALKNLPKQTNIHTQYSTNWTKSKLPVLPLALKCSQL